MAAAGQHDRGVELRHEFLHIGNVAFHPREFDDRIAVPGNVERRHADRQAVERREQFPIAVDVAIGNGQRAELRVQARELGCRQPS